MGAAPVNNDLVEQNNRLWDEQKRVMNVVVVGDAQGLGSFEVDELRTNGEDGEINNGSDGAIQVLACPQKPQPQRPVVHWERFLPVGSLKVLLVENDYSTRHVVSALLRNCSYEVTAVANGLQAWKILQDLTNHIDLVLSEVVVPFLSGIGLLCKIMNHKTLKNTPMIMMSSHDSMGLVFKCLSKGAVDFLVKPIRKNELKNLWQHVWRRCHSSSGSWSESETQTTKSVKSKSNDQSEYNSGSSDDGLTIRDGIENKNATQSSWTKSEADMDSPRPLSTWDQPTDAPDSQIIHTKPETCSSKWIRDNERNECLEQDEQLDKIAIGKDLEIGMHVDPDSLLEIQHKSSTHPSSKRRIKLSELVSMAFEKEEMEIKSGNLSSKLGDHAANLISTMDSFTGLADTTQVKDKSGSDSRDFPSTELTLKRLIEVGDVQTGELDDRNVSRHPDLSAFSKYNTDSSVNHQGPLGNVGSCSPLDNSSIAMKTKTMHNSTYVPSNQQSNGSSNNNDMGSTTKYVSNPEEAQNDKFEPVLAVKCSHSSAFQPVQNGQLCVQKVLPGKEDAVAVGTDQVQVQHHHHHYHHHHHHVHNTHRGHDDISSNIVQGPIDGDAGNYSVNRSASGSKHGSNGPNGSSNALNARPIKVDSGHGAGISERVSGNGTAECRFAQREATMTKFHQKRKERCFEKKVRYQSRKRFSEQIPHIRGQFVRQTEPDTEADKDGNTAPEDISCDSVQ